MSDLGPEARSILDAGRDGDNPTGSDRARVKKNLSRMIAAGGVIGAASAAGTAAEGATATATATVAAKAASIVVIGKVLGGVAFVAALGSGIWLSRPQGPGAPPASTAVQNIAPPASTAASPGNTGSPGGLVAPQDSPAIAPTAAAPASSDSPSAPVPSAAAEAPEADPAHPAQKPSASAKASSSTPVAADADPLEDETRRLREVHGALQSGDPEKAMKLLDEQSITYATGQLGQEREVARVLTLCKLGKVDEARAAAATFLRNHPSSPLVARVSAGCPAAPSP